MALRILKTKSFQRRLARKHKISDDSLVDVVEKAEKGLIDADLGRHLIKQRVARPGRGAREGYRVFIAWKKGERAVFMYGFPKSERENLDDDQLTDWQDAAEIFLKLTDVQIDHAIAEGEALEVEVDEDDAEV